MQDATPACSFASLNVIKMSHDKFKSTKSTRHAEMMLAGLSMQVAQTIICVECQQNSRQQTTNTMESYRKDQLDHCPTEPHHQVWM